MSSSQIVKIGKIYEKEVHYGLQPYNIIAVGSSGSGGDENANGISLPKPKVTVPEGKNVTTRYLLNNNMELFIDSVGGLPQVGSKLRLIGTPDPIVATLTSRSVNPSLMNGIFSINSIVLENTLNETIALQDIISGGYNIAEFIPQNDEVFCDPSDMEKLYNDGPSTHNLGAFTFYGVYYMADVNNVTLSFLHYPESFTGLTEGTAIDVVLPTVEGLRRMTISNPQALSGTGDGALRTQNVAVQNENPMHPMPPFGVHVGAFYSTVRENVIPVQPLKTTAELISANIQYDPQEGFDLPNYGNVSMHSGNNITISVFFNNIVTIGDKITLTHSDGTQPKEVTVKSIVMSGASIPFYYKEIDVGESISTDYKHWRFGGIEQSIIDPKLFLLPTPVSLDSLGIKYFNYLVQMPMSGPVELSRSGLTNPVAGEILNIIDDDWDISTDELVSITPVVGPPVSHELAFGTSYTDRVVYREPTAGLLPKSAEMPPSLARAFRASRFYNFHT